MDHTNKLSEGFFDWITDEGTTWQHREATRKAIRVQDCYSFYVFDRIEICN